MVIGKLKQVLKSRCPYCGKRLQLRSYEKKGLLKGERITLPVDIIVCPGESCDYQEEVEQKRVRREKV